MERVTHLVYYPSSEHLATNLQTAVCPYTNPSGSLVQHALHCQRDLRPDQRIDACTSRGRPPIPNGSAPYTQVDDHHPISRVPASGRRETFSYIPVPSLRVDELTTDKDGRQG
jgi:hypothetical protein